MPHSSVDLCLWIGQTSGVAALIGISTGHTGLSWHAISSAAAAMVMLVMSVD
jgi:hypothetical protein